MQVTGQQIKRKRQQMGLSQQNIADRVGISKGYVCDIENGKKQNISHTIYQKILEILEMKEAVNSESFQLLKLQAELSAGCIAPATAVPKLLDLLHALPSSFDLLPDLYFLLAKLYYRQSEWNRCQTYAKLAYDCVKKSGNYLFQSRCYLLLALLEARKGSIHSALERFLLVEGNLRSRTLPPLFSSFVYGMIAVLQGRLNRIEQAVYFHQKAKPWLHQAPIMVYDVQKMSQYIQNLYTSGLELEKNGACKDAQQLYEDCVKFGEWQENLEINLTLQLEIALLHIRNQNHFEANELLQSICENLEQSKATHTYLYLHALNLLADIRMQEKEYEQVVKYSDHVYQEAYKQYQELAAVALRNKANVLLERDQNSCQYDMLMKQAISLIQDRDKQDVVVGILSDRTLRNKLQQEYLSKRK